MTQILICADAQAQIGTGHLRRMLTLAEALLEQDKDLKVTFQTSDLGAGIVRDRGLAIATHIAPCQLAPLRETLSQAPYALVILDNYHWSAPTQTPLRDVVARICVVDDLADRPHDADILLDQNAHHSDADYEGLVPADCLRLVGAQYCLLGRAFRHAEAAPCTDANAPVFVSLGGGDPGRDLLAVTETLLSATPYRLSIATGSHIADARALAELAADHSARVELQFDSRHVADQMRASQFAVAAAGTMTWERAALSLAALSLIVADNQAEAALWLAQRDIHATFDLRGDWSRVALAGAVNGLGRDRARRALFARKSGQLISGQGAVRAAEALLNSIRS